MLTDPQVGKDWRRNRLSLQYSPDTAAFGAVLHEVVPEQHRVFKLYKSWTCKYFGREWPATKDESLTTSSRLMMGKQFCLNQMERYSWLLALGY